MRDGINLELAGVPAVIITHDVFENAARAQSKSLGQPDLRLIVFPQPKGEEEEIEGAESARQVVDQLADMVREASI